MRLIRNQQVVGSNPRSRTRTGQQAEAVRTPFYEAFTSNRANFDTFTIDAFDTPNFEKLRELAGADKGRMVKLLAELPADNNTLTYAPRPYLVTPLWAREKLYEWGEESPLWQWKVRGQFPLQAEDALISLEWLEKAATPLIRPGDESQLFCGIDVAAGGGDETVAVLRTKKGRIVTWGSWYGHSTGQVIDFLRPHRDRIKEINFDSAGPGEYFDRDLDHAGFRGLNGVNVGESSRSSDRFRNLKAELYWQLRERFKAGEISGLTDELTISQLATLRFEINPRGQVEMESKDSMRKRGVKSPDRAEAMMLCFADRTPAFIRFTEDTVMRAVHNKDAQGDVFIPDDFSAEELEEAWVRCERSLTFAAVFLRQEFSRHRRFESTPLRQPVIATGGVQRIHVDRPDIVVACRPSRQYRQRARRNEFSRPARRRPAARLERV